MEIDCSEKFGENEKSATKELNIDDKNGGERGLPDKEQKDMVANAEEGGAATTKTADLTAATAGADTESGTDGGGSGGGGRPTVEFVQKVIDSQDCDKTPEKCMETKSQTDLSSSPGQDDDKEDGPELLTPMAEYVVQDGQVEEEDECEKSSSVKGCEEELISDTEEYNEEQDAGDVTEIIEDDDDEDENDTSSVPSEVENMNRSKGTSDADDDSDEDEYNEDDDDDVELVPDSSDEEGSEDSRNVSSRNLDIPLSDDDDDDGNYDDDDLMNDVILASKKAEIPVSRRKEESSRSGISRLKNTGDFKKKLRWDYRTQLKKRSVRWLIKRLHKEPLSGVHYACRSQGSELVKSSPAQIKKNHDIEVISIDLDDSPEKSQPATSLPSHQLKESSVKPPVFEMQQVDKIRDSIQSAEDLKQQQQQQVKSLKDEQNKENVENNDKLLNNSLKLNGNVSNAKTEDKTKGDGEKSENHKDMDVSVEDGEEKSSEQTIVEIADKVEKGIDEENRDEQVKADDTNQEKITKTDKNPNEAVPNEVSELELTTTAEEKSIYKESVATDLKIPPRTSKRSRSASLENSPKLEDIHPTKKLRAELESNFPTHDRILSEYIDKTSNNSVDEIQKHMNQLIIEIQTLNDMIKTKEIEWNNMLHLKKVKEEICFRLSRKKQVMEIMSTKAGEATMTGGEDTLNDTILQNPNSKPLKLVASTPNTSAVAPNLSASAIAATSNLSSGNAGSTAQSILQNRANMKSSDLAKEKANTQRLHRLLVSRNILPKPSSTSCTAVAGFGASPQVSIPSISSMLASSTATTAAAAAAATSATGLMNIPLSMASGSLGVASNGAHGTQQPILNSYLTAAATVQQQLGEMLNGHHNPSLLQPGNTNGGQTLMVGRQGVFKDVKSIIADYRQRHPEAVPRRGRRVKSNPSATDSSSILSNVLKNDGKLAGLDLGAVLTKFDGNSRPSSNDSSHSMTNLIGTNSNSANLGNVSFKDVLVQFAKMSGQTERMSSTATANKLPGSTATGSGSQSAPPPYPEVTLHPVSTTQSNADQTGSLLHGILTKYTRPNASSVTSAAPTSTSQTTVSQSFSSSFSPTLARLLTAPERITTAQNSQPNSTNSFQTNLQAVQSAVAGSGLNLSKVVGHNSEITITPVLSGQPLQQTLVQQQFQHQQQQQQLKEIRERVKAENMLNLDAEADDSVDRLVIDEGGDSAGMDGHHRIAPHAIGQEFHENEVPACQGCKKQEAQFVCAGCGNQWYCSRDCQVAAWDEHSEVCTG